MTELWISIFGYEYLEFTTIVDIDNSVMETITLGSRIAIPVRQSILTFFSHRYDAYSGQYVN